MNEVSINRKTSISLGLVLILLGAVVTMIANFMALKITLRDHLEDYSKIEQTYVRKDIYQKDIEAMTEIRDDLKIIKAKIMGIPVKAEKKETHAILFPLK